MPSRGAPGSKEWEEDAEATAEHCACAQDALLDVLPKNCVQKFPLPHTADASPIQEPTPTPK